MQTQIEKIAVNLMRAGTVPGQVVAIVAAINFVNDLPQTDDSIAKLFAQEYGMMTVEHIKDLCVEMK